MIGDMYMLVLLQLLLKENKKTEENKKDVENKNETKKEKEPQPHQDGQLPH